MIMSFFFVEDSLKLSLITAFVDSVTFGLTTPWSYWKCLDHTSRKNTDTANTWILLYKEYNMNNISVAYSLCATVQKWQV